MIKRLIYRLIKFLFGVSIEDLIARNKSLESDLGAIEIENSQLKLQIELQKNQLVENEGMLFALRNEVKSLNQEKKAIILRYILTDGKDNYYQKKLEDSKWIAKRDEINKRDEYSCQICHSKGEKLIQIDSIDRLLQYVDFYEVFEAVKNVFNEQDKYIKEFKLACESEVDDNTLLNYDFIETYLHDTDVYINSFNLKDNPFNDKGFEFLTKNKFEGDSLGRNSKWVNMIKFRYHTKNSIEETQSMRIEFFKAGNTDHKLILRHLYDYANLPYRGQGILTQDGFSIVFPLYRLNGTTLNVHHKAYYEGLEPWECPDNELVTLCNHCHMKEHENPIPVKKFAIN